MKKADKKTLPIRLRLGNGKTADIAVTTEVIVTGGVTEARKLTRKERDETLQALQGHVELALKKALAG